MTAQNKTIGWVWQYENGDYSAEIFNTAEICIGHFYKSFNGKAIEVIAKPEPMSKAEILQL